MSKIVVFIDEVLELWKQISVIEKANSPILKEEIGNNITQIRALVSDRKFDDAIFEEAIHRLFLTNTDGTNHFQYHRSSGLKTPYSAELSLMDYNRWFDRNNDCYFEPLIAFKECILGKSAIVGGCHYPQTDTRIQYFRQICMYLSARYGSQSNLEARLIALEDDLKAQRIINGQLIERIKILERKTGNLYPEYDYASMKETKHALHAEMHAYYKPFAKLLAIAYNDLVATTRQ